MPDTCPTILLDSCSADRFSASWRFSGHVGTLAAMTADQVLSVLLQAETATRQGFYAVGFVAYEAAQAFNPHLPALPPRSGLPLAWFSLFRERHCVTAGDGLPDRATATPGLQPACSPADYGIAISRIHTAIEQGESYQINHTFPLQGQWQGDPRQLYRSLLLAQRPAFGAYLETGSHTIISASPELFFAVQGETITTRPMKGTAPRGRFPAEDRALREQLQQDMKERAENLMIVDLLRNDLGQLARTGTVQTERLFEVETYPTVHQMTSTITAKLKPDTSVPALFKALFPCGSVTGAPKRRSMELISGLEQQPRGIYCGAIGYLAPGGEAAFSVAIRTLLLEQQTGRISMGVGSAITWDARATSEYAECLNKAAFLKPRPQPRLLESLLLEQGSYPRLEQHLERLCWSASRLGYCGNREQIRQALLAHAAGTTGQHKTRLLLAPDGSLQIESAPLQQLQQPLKVALATTLVDPAELLLYLKTEQREHYDQARQEQPEADEVLLCNRRGELTEGSFTNLVLKLDNRLVTPPLASGLLPGVMRQQLLEQGTIEERLLYPQDLQRAEEIWLINSVRGWLRAELIKGVET
ncbi:aminodeoxychorismate synthase component I [Trichlorobacter lovleyi]|uniref:aminodeoxychorismate synthase component I n=1 Tax=Trichlorobacter lovleyi TaxID=313985 RepID=UPI002240AC45|nr:aminodeoxychorismate synthase component I [Trichlorobacter lovleyi]QOX77553.1 aminodeoxychorismate synthase component I [Trichlorobacter lovleyi]